MGKCSTHPFIIDRCRQINMKDLKDWGYLKNRGSKMFSITWTLGNEISNISVWLVKNREKGFLELSYIIDSIPVKYKIRLITKPSNLGKGVVWYFVCPATQKLCRKLYLGNRYFIHRDELEGSYYSKQVRSKKYREMVRVFGAGFEADELYDEIYSKNFRRFYKGKPTKRFKAIVKRLMQLEGNKFNLKDCL